MKKYLLAAFSLFTFANVDAQITITDADMPSLSGVYVRDNANATNAAVVDLSVTGPNTTWDYSTMGSSNIDTIDYVSVSSTSFGYQLYFNNPLSPSYHSDLAVKGINFPSIPGSPISITNVINYFKIDGSNGYIQTGFGATISALPASVKYTPRDKVLPLPCTYGITESNPFQWLFQVPTIGAYGQNKVRTTEVDGWGTLILPNGGSYQVLRVKSTLTGFDTISFGPVNLGIPSTQIEYRWIAQGEGEPVMRANATQLGGTSQLTNLNYKHHDPNGLQAKSMLNTQLDLYPNPASSMINVNYFTPVSDAMQINIYDLTGVLVYQKSGQSQANTNNKYQIELSNLASGMYHLVITQQGSVATAKISVQ